MPCASLPTTFANHGACISFFAKNRDFALAPQGTLGTSVKLSKNFHGKLVSGLQSWCDGQVKATSTTSRAETSSRSIRRASAGCDASFGLELDGATHSRVAVTDLAGDVLVQTRSDIPIADGPDTVLGWLEETFGFKVREYVVTDKIEDELKRIFDTFTQVSDTLRRVPFSVR